MEETIVKQQVKSFTYHSPSKRFSICGVVNEVLGTLQVGLALKNDMDNFSRKMGHKIALGRALKNPVHSIELSHANPTPGREFYGYAKLFEIIYQILEDKTPSTLEAVIIRKKKLSVG